MNIKKIIIPTLIKIANSPKGPAVQNLLRGMSEIVDAHAGRQFREKMTDRLSISHVIDSHEIHELNKCCITDKHDKIKVRFYHYHPTTFNVIETVCEAFKNDERFDVLIVLFDRDFVANANQMKEKGFNYIEEFNYDITTDRPDISIIYHLEIQYPPQLIKIRDYSSFVALVPLGLGSMWYGDTERTIKRMNLDRYKADMCFVGNLCYDGLIDAIGENVIEKCTPAQFDLSFRKLKANKQYPPGWEKLKGKKVAMLMTDHGLRMNTVSDEVTFDLYFTTLINYAKQHNNFGLILRLHPALVNELLSTYWSIGDYQSFVDYCNNSENIVWDTTNDYLNGLSIADASLVDVNCSLVYFVLAANKPIGALLRNDMSVVINNPDLINHYYRINSIEKLIDFLDEIRFNNDSMYQSRQDAFKSYIEHFDGLNGARIKEAICQKYFKMKRKNLYNEK